ncbi:MAG: asparagine synthase-related protein [Candidatus Paceibacterota bacterium]
MNKFRELMLNSMSEGGCHPIFLSGGIDSATILAASLVLGWKPLCITFHLDEESDDARIAKSMAETFNCEIEVIKISSDIETLKRDVETIIDMGTIRKTYIQCMQPFLYMVPELKKRGYDTGYWGMGSGDLVGDSREAYFAHHRSVVEWNKKRRKDSYIIQNDPIKTSDGWIMLKLKKYYDFNILDPYHNTPLKEYVLERTFEEIHKPKNKILHIDAFPHFWNTNKLWYRRHANMQINSGIREWHDNLLDLPQYKMLQSKSVTKIYNHMKKEENSLERFINE